MIYLLGLGVDVNAELAFKYFKIIEEDGNALNALGYIYYMAPDYLSQDTVLKKQFGSIR